MKSAPRILIVGPSWVGDMVMAQSLFITLKQRHPAAAIDVLAPAWTLPLLQRMPEVARGIAMPLGHGQFGFGARRKLGLELRGRYDWSIVLPNSWKSALVPFFAGIPRRTGYLGELRYGLLNDARKLDKAGLPRTVQRFVALGLERDSVLPPECPVPRLNVPAEGVAAVQIKFGLAAPGSHNQGIDGDNDDLSQNGASPRQGMPGSMAMDGAQRRPVTSLSLDSRSLSDSAARRLSGIPCRNDGLDAAFGSSALQEGARAILALCPGAEYGPAKRWPAAYFAELARAKQAQGWAVWLFGSGKDRDVAEEIAAAAPGCVTFAGRTDLAEAVDLLSLADAVVSNDSGLMHVAAALGKPLVAIYGSSDPGFTPPLSEKARILRLGLECSPCFERDCPLGHTRCLVDIRPEQALAELEKLTALRAESFSPHPNPLPEEEGG